MLVSLSRPSDLFCCPHKERLPWSYGGPSPSSICGSHLPNKADGVPGCGLRADLILNRDGLHHGTLPSFSHLLQRKILIDDVPKERAPAPTGLRCCPVNGF